MQENDPNLKPEGFNYPLFDEERKVICQICGRKFMILTPSHLKTHDGMTYSKYKDKFLGAPITNEEFKALSKYSRPSKYSDEDFAILGDEKVIDEDIPVIDDEFEIPKIQVAKEFATPMDAKKHEIFSFLVNYLPDVKMDSLIEIYDVQQRLIFSVISDFSDPFMKICIQFPDTFWHNLDAVGEDPNRDRKLAEHGWTTINIKSAAPSIKAIEKAIRKNLNL